MESIRWSQGDKQGSQRATQPIALLGVRSVKTYREKENVSPYHFQQIISVKKPQQK